MKHTNFIKLNKVFSILRELNGDFPLPLAQVLLEVGQNPDGVTVSQVVSRTGLSQSSGSRHCRALTDMATPIKEGYGLAKWLHCPNDFRSKLLVLNEKGQELHARLEAALK
tara:strand:- start:1450 stop:1782 length:333 start_codon:yes stop_codon:yes gene_type:complete